MCVFEIGLEKKGHREGVILRRVCLFWRVWELTLQAVGIHSFL